MMTNANDNKTQQRYYGDGYMVIVNDLSYDVLYISGDNIMATGSIVVGLGIDNLARLGNFQEYVNKMYKQP